MVPHAAGLSFLDGQGAVLADWPWAERVADCDGCFGQGASWDGSGWLAIWGEADNLGRVFGSVLTLGASGEVLAETGPMNFPHDVLRDPLDGSLVVAETFAGRVVWTSEGGEVQPIRWIDGATDGWVSTVPNGIQFLRWEGRDLLLLTLRGTDTDPETGGRIVLWDVTDRGDPQRAWAFPEDGVLSDVHGARLFCEEDGWTLLAAQSTGLGPGRGTVLVATAARPVDPPVYLADLAPPDEEQPLLFPRSAVLDGDDIIVTDSGAEGLLNAADLGRILRLPRPDLEPTGATGDASSGMVLLRPEGWEPVQEGLTLPFEAWIGPRPPP